MDSNFTVEVKIPVSEASTQEACDTLRKMGAKFIGGYGKRDTENNAADYIGGNLIQLGEMYFLLFCDSENSKLILNHIEITEEYVFAQTMQIKVTGLQGGKTKLFGNKDDAINWLARFSDRDLREITVEEPKFFGSAMIYKASGK